MSRLALYCTARSHEAVLLENHLARAFDRLIERAARQRNAILHGADTAKQVVASIEPFIGWLQSQLARDALGAAEDQTSLAVRLEHRRNIVRKRWQTLSDGKDPGQALFGPIT